MADEFIWCPQVGASSEVSHVRTVVQYGDGYSAAINEGINSKTQRWDLSFTGKSAEISPIKAFLDQRQGTTSFTWTPPLEVESRFRAEPYTVNALGSDNYTLTVTFVQVYRP